MKDYLYKAFLLSFSFILVSLSYEGKSQEIDENGIPPTIQSETKTINIGYVIERGLRENTEEKSRLIQQKLLSLEDKDNEASFWYPEIGLSLKTTKQKVGNFWSKSGGDSYSKTPKTEIGLEIKDYTLFNWGIDYLNYENKKMTIKRNQESLQDSRRDLKLHLIELYFELVKNKTIEQIYKENLKKASFIYRMDREKAVAHKVSKQQYFQSRNLYLMGQQEYNTARITQKESDKKLSYYLNDDPNIFYTPLEKLKYQELRMRYEEAIRLSKMKNGLLLNYKQQLDNARRSLEISQKESLALPKFSLTLGTYTKNFSPNDSHDGIETHHNGGPGGKNVDLKVEINMTWTILGEGGFFNHRKRAKAFYEKAIAENRYNGLNNGLEIKIRSLYEEINEYEKQMTIWAPLLENSRKQYDETLDNYLKGKTSFIFIKDALNSLKYAEIQYENLKFNHLKKKLKLASTIGIEDLPGEVFEKLVVMKE